MGRAVISSIESLSGSKRLQVAVIRRPDRSESRNVFIVRLISERLLKTSAAWHRYCNVAIAIAECSRARQQNRFWHKRKY